MKTIIEMAREADVYCTTRQPTLDAMLERFAALVRAEAQAEERNANAKTCADLYKKWIDELNNDTDEEDDPAPPDWLDCKLAIEARGNT